MSVLVSQHQVCLCVAPHSAIPDAGTDTGWSIALQPDGKLVFCGVSSANAVIGRLNADGSLDTAFDGPSGTGNGKFPLDLGGTDRALRLAIGGEKGDITQSRAANNE